MATTIIKATPILLAGLVLAGCNSSSGGGEQTPEPTPVPTVAPTPLPTPLPVQPLALNDTGVLTCGDAATLVTAERGSGISYTNQQDCNLTNDADGDAIPAGQDGHYGRDVTAADNIDGTAGFSFTKLDPVNGGDLASNASAWGCVRDEVTGLVWEVKDESPGSIHHPNFAYSWFSSSPSSIGAGVNGGKSGAGNCNISDTSLTKCDTEELVQRVNESALCGVSNWRLPTRNELMSLVDYGFNDSQLKQRNAAIDIKFFPSARPTQYWTSSPAIQPDDSAVGYTTFVGYTVNFGTGLLEKSARNASDTDLIGRHLVRLVSDGQ